MVSLAKAFNCRARNLDDEESEAIRAILAYAPRLPVPPPAPPRHRRKIPPLPQNAFHQESLVIRHVVSVSKSFQPALPSSRMWPLLAMSSYADYHDPPQHSNEPRRPDRSGRKRHYPAAG